MNTTTQTLAVIANDPKLYTVEDLKTIMQEAKQVSGNCSTIILRRLECKHRW